MSETNFRALYECEFAVEPHPCADLADEYHTRAEAYDRTVCTGPMGRDGIMPANGYELGLINRNAHKILAELRQRAAARGHTSEQLLEAIRQR